jgi:hypothetical protein
MKMDDPAADCAIEIPDYEVEDEIRVDFARTALAGRVTTAAGVRV